MQSTILEVCCGSYEDAVIAARGGADRIELNTGLFLGGLTPSVASLLLVKERVTVPIIAMVRPRGAGFCYSTGEYDQMKGECRALLENKADGVAFGFLEENKEPNVKRIQEFVAMIHSYGAEAVFHRAFDCTNDLNRTTEQLIEAKVDRILTSGGKGTAIEGKKVIRDLVKQYGNAIQFVAGSGVNQSNISKLILDTRIGQVHSSCKAWKTDETTYQRTVDYSFSHVKGGYDVVDEGLVYALKRECCRKRGEESNA